MACRVEVPTATGMEACREPAAGMQACRESTLHACREPTGSTGGRLV
jgi:hypothetical protein